jgi:hypothetical protein
MRNKIDKHGKVKVQVKWKDSRKADWQYLYDMWADYPAKVIEYQKKNKCRGKLWKVPKIEDVQYFVRILGMIGEAKNDTETEFIVLANNGYKFDGVKYHELETDDPDLLRAFLGSVEDSSETVDGSLSTETDDASVA